MKPTRFTNGRLFLGVFAVALTIGLVSWDYKQSPGRTEQASQDTIPKKSNEKEKKIRDLDDVIGELDNVDLDIEMSKVRTEIAEAMKNLNVDVKLQVENAMKEAQQAIKELDMEKIRKDVEQSLASVDFAKVKEELAEAMKDFDAAKIQQEVQAAMASVDMKKIEAEMEKVKNIDMEKMQRELNDAQKEMAKIGPEIEKSLAKAKVEIAKAKEEMKEYKAFVDGLDKDGLINKKEEYQIEHEDGKLEINGKQASDAVYNKYRTFLEKHKDFNIKKTADDFDIDID